MSTGVIRAYDVPYQKRDRAGAFTNEWLIGHYISGMGLVAHIINGRMVNISTAEVYLNGWQEIDLTNNINTIRNLNQWYIQIPNIPASLTLVNGASYLIRVSGTYT